MTIEEEINNIDRYIIDYKSRWIGIYNEYLMIQTRWEYLNHINRNALPDLKKVFNEINKRIPVLNDLFDNSISNLRGILFEKKLEKLEQLNTVFTVFSSFLNNLKLAFAQRTVSLEISSPSEFISTSTNLPHGQEVLYLVADGLMINYLQNLSEDLRENMFWDGFINFLTVQKQDIPVEKAGYLSLLLPNRKDFNPRINEDLFYIDHFYLFESAKYSIKNYIALSHELGHAITNNPKFRGDLLEYINLFFIIFNNYTTEWLVKVPEDTDFPENSRISFCTDICRCLFSQEIINKEINRLVEIITLYLEFKGKNKDNNSENFKPEEASLIELLVKIQELTINFKFEEILELADIKEEILSDPVLAKYVNFINHSLINNKLEFEEDFIQFEESLEFFFKKSPILVSKFFDYIFNILPNKCNNLNKKTIDTLKKYKTYLGYNLISKFRSSPLFSSFFEHQIDRYAFHLNGLNVVDVILGNEITPFYKVSSTNFLMEKILEKRLENNEFNFNNKNEKIEELRRNIREKIDFLMNCDENIVDDNDLLKTIQSEYTVLKNNSKKEFVKNEIKKISPKYSVEEEYMFILIRYLSYINYAKDYSEYNINNNTPCLNNRIFQDVEAKCKEMKENLITKYINNNKILPDECKKCIDKISTLIGCANYYHFRNKEESEECQNEYEEILSKTEKIINSFYSKIENSIKKDFYSKYPNNESLEDLFQTGFSEIQFEPRHLLDYYYDNQQIQDLKSAIPLMKIQEFYYTNQLD
ncbi:MAG: hypothetical protein GF308_07425 [Candidatus Heimdallarchaeota archaeon]|nr:hypothetical protein [Candidatus Heimdallarchaeota archaeon]